jgi:membrane protease subunit HflC
MPHSHAHEDAEDDLLHEHGYGHVHEHEHGHGHGHGHEHGHGHGHEHGHGHGHGHREGRRDPAGRLRVAVRLALAGVLVVGAGLAASAVMVGAGQAIVVTQFGDPVRVLTVPGLAWKIPAPVQGTIAVDLRLRGTSTGLQDVGTKDGLRILVQAYVAWQVPSEPAGIRQFVRAVRNDPDEAARQLRSLVGSALQVTASSFDLSDLVNTDPGRVQLGAFETKLREQIQRQVLDNYGIAIRQVGIERLSLPETTLAATVGRMRSERETVAAQRTAEGLRAAARIRSEATRDARITVAGARTEAAEIEAASRREAAEINARAYDADPGLYLMLRSLDTLATVVGPNTRLILRTDAAPINTLVQGPPASGGPSGGGSGLAEAGPRK